MIVAITQTGINHHGRIQAAMNITSKLNTINAPVNIDTSYFYYFTLQMNESLILIITI